MSNLNLWDRVQTTDPKYTKTFTRAGGFSGTAINAVYQAKRATDVFGPMGIGWGIEIVNEELLQGAPLLHNDAVVGHELIHKVQIKLWYILDGNRGEVTHFGQTTFVGKNKYGFYTDEEAPKKSLTDAMLKALSLLGFSADVHLGLFDDNKYVNDLKRAMSDEQRPAASESVNGSAAATGNGSKPANQKQYEGLLWRQQKLGWDDQRFDQFLIERNLDWDTLTSMQASKAIEDLEAILRGSVERWLGQTKPLNR